MLLCASIVEFFSHKINYIDKNIGNEFELTVVFPNCDPPTAKKVEKVQTEY